MICCCPNFYSEGSQYRCCPLLDRKILDGWFWNPCSALLLQVQRTCKCNCRWCTITHNYIFIQYRTGPVRRDGQCMDHLLPSTQETNASHLFLTRASHQTMLTMASKTHRSSDQQELNVSSWRVTVQTIHRILANRFSARKLICQNVYHNIYVTGSPTDQA